MKKPTYLKPDETENLKKEYFELLEKTLPESAYQLFLEKNTNFVPREFEQNHGIHFSLVFKKLPLFDDYVTDFCYLTKSSVKWYCVLIELEKPSSKFFTNNNDFHRDFLRGINQIDRWKAWMNNEANKRAWLDKLAPIRTPLHDNPCEIKYVLVHGRRKEYEGNKLRTSLIHAKEDANFRITSFDSLAERIESKYPLYVGTKKNEYFDIISHDFVNEQIFTWPDTKIFRISDKLRNDAIAKRDTWCSYSNFNGFENSEKTLDKTLNECGVLPKSLWQS